MKKTILILSFWFSILLLSAQTIFQPGEVFVLGLIANSSSCGGASAEDRIFLVSTVDIEPGTILDLTDNGWEREIQNYFGTGEGVYRMTRIGPTISAGTIFTFTFSNSNNSAIINADNPGWQHSSLVSGFYSLNLSSDGDQLFLMQGGNWSDVGTNQATYSGQLLFGFNTKNQWSALANDSQNSGLPLELQCYSAQGTQASTGFIYYGGNTSPTDFTGWMIRVQIDSNWQNVANCSQFYDEFSLNSIVIDPVFVSGPNHQEICSSESPDALEAFTHHNLYEFQWYENTSHSYEGAVAIVGANSASYTPSIQSETDMYYFCELTRISGGLSCTIRSEIYDIIIHPLPLTSNISPN